MSNNKQSSVDLLLKKLEKIGVLNIKNCHWSDEVNVKKAIEQAKAMENEQKNNLPIHIHEGIENTWVYIEDGIVHVKPKPKANEQQ